MTAKGIILSSTIASLDYDQIKALYIKTKNNEVLLCLKITPIKLCAIVMKNEEFPLVWVAVVGSRTKTKPY